MLDSRAASHHLTRCQRPAEQSAEPNAELQSPQQPLSGHFWKEAGLRHGKEKQKHEDSDGDRVSGSHSGDEYFIRADTSYQSTSTSAQALITTSFSVTSHELVLTSSGEPPVGTPVASALYLLTSVANLTNARVAESAHYSCCRRRKRQQRRPCSSAVIRTPAYLETSTGERRNLWTLVEPEGFLERRLFKENSISLAADAA
ncbi:unnamed protein product [Pleuronectes platessa]|uniref:Uncharacterized protein n=1 Tax=Pleuronectes platessa TaxID=8262 RepID=A0A9N7Z2W8_PLEPL|nr:unnamed protein product [Pleuronectes platessa]